MERKEELEMLIEKTRSNIRYYGDRLRHVESYTDQSYLNDIIKYTNALKEYQKEYSEIVK